MPFAHCHKHGFDIDGKEQRGGRPDGKGEKGVLLRMKPRRKAPASLVPRFPSFVVSLGKLTGFPGVCVAQENRQKQKAQREA
ncbi:hypothetical protein JCM16814_28240 [Desulfobaculum senezii]